MKSESARLLRQWWNEPGDYEWVVDFFQPRGFVSGLRAIIGSGGLLMAIALLCLLSEHLRGPRVVSYGVVSVMAAGALGWAVCWWFLPWPSARQSGTMFALADICIAVAAALHANPLVALSTTPLFAMTGAYVVFFHGPRANAAHMVFAAATIVAAATWLAVSHQPDAVPVAISKAIVALTLTVGVFPFVQFGFWLVRSNSVESLTDPLTDLANRRGLSNHLARKLNRQTSRAEPLCAFVIDLDGFKNINDEYGHKIGDAVIVRTAEQIRAAVHPSAFVARTGGEEFVVIDRLELDDAPAIAEAIRAAIEAPDTPKATASVGVAVGDITDVAEFEAIYSCADEAMYAAKRDGGNRIALGGVVDLAHPDRQHNEIPYRRIGLNEEPLLSSDGI